MYLISQSFCVRLIVRHPLQRLAQSYTHYRLPALPRVTCARSGQGPHAFRISPLCAVLPSGSASRENSAKIVCPVPHTVPTAVEALSNGELFVKCMIINQVISPVETPHSALWYSGHLQVLFSRLEQLLMYNSVPWCPSDRCTLATTSLPPGTQVAVHHLKCGQSQQRCGLYHNIV